MGIIKYFSQHKLERQELTNIGNFMHHNLKERGKRY